MQSWIERGMKPVVISTNFSRRHFEQNSPAFVRKIQNLIDYYRVPAEYIEIEITESAVVDNIDAIRRNMEELKKIGFRIAIDDFGTGYSSLNVLLEIPANVIKFDRGFVLHSLQNDVGLTIMKNLVETFKEISFEVLCEGVETKEEEKNIVECGCDIIQGYLYDRPLGVTDFEEKYVAC